eukprot:GHUV01048236.1.p1 GENE.GHUV01048236.1~~GHUV01048236.1.p1  ORF type:complete len:409 (+),score=120.29 GHUV01048236.1:169-1395(+)
MLRHRTAGSTDHPAPVYASLVSKNCRLLLLGRSEEVIRQYYAVSSAEQQQQLTDTADHQTAVGASAAATISSDATNAQMNQPDHAAAVVAASSSNEALRQPLPQQQHKHQQQLTQNQLLSSRYSPQFRDHESFSTWFPGLKLSGTDVQSPRAVIVCFHNSGNAEDMYTSEGTGTRRAGSPLLELCRAQGWQVLAPQLPGRGLRSKEPYATSLKDLAQQLLPHIAAAVCSANGRYALVGHSMGCWAAYELLLALKQEGFGDPAVACLSAMPWPHMPMEQRPWRQQKTLSEAEFKVECERWDISEIVFSPDLWDMYQPMLRADFRLFDEYHPSVAQQPATAVPQLSCPLRLFWGDKDRRVTEQMVKEWGRYTTGVSTGTSIPGNHLFPLNPECKQQWLAGVAAALRQALG